MVSTRGCKFKFIIGERVLCYEPDLKKAKVLYDSKVCFIVIMFHVMVMSLIYFTYIYIKTKALDVFFYIFIKVPKWFYS